MPHGLLLALVLLAASAVAHAQRSDLVFLENGDRITGQVETLEAGILEISTDTTSNRVRIEWRFVERLVSGADQSLELADGRRLFIFPSLTDLGRVRADFRSTFTIQVTGDLDWALEGYFRFDSDPLSEAGDRTDYGMVMQLKYSF